jgi:hypothetical protein
MWEQLAAARRLPLYLMQRVRVHSDQHQITPTRKMPPCSFMNLRGGGEMNVIVVPVYSEPS